VGAVVGIVLGFGLGALANLHPAPLLTWLGTVAAPVGQLWTRALLLVVVPLIVCFLVLAASGDGVKRAAKVGGVSLAVFTAMMVASAFYTLFLGVPLLKGTPADAGAFARAVAEAGSLGIPAVEPAATPGFGQTLVALVPDNIFRAAADGNLMALIVVSILFGFALAHVGPQKESILALVRAVRDAVFMAT